MITHTQFGSGSPNSPFSYLNWHLAFLWSSFSNYKLNSRKQEIIQITSKYTRKKKKKRYPYALTRKEIYYILLNKNAGIWTAWVVWLHLCQNMEGKLSMRCMQIKFLEGYTRKQTVVASGEMRLRCGWWKRESLLYGTLHSSPPFDFSREHVLER